jgi:O-succinylbenzoate synthase
VKLAGFSLYRYGLPLAAPISLDGGVLTRRDGLLLELTGEDGATGWGDVAPLPGFSRESVQEAANALCAVCKEMAGREVTDDCLDSRGDLARELDRRDLPPSARFGFETAVWNLYAASEGESLPELLDPRPRTIVPVNGLLAGSTPEVLADAHRMRLEGYGAVKLKVGGRTVEEDASLARAVKEEIGGGVALRLDANRAWSLEEARVFARGVRDVRIEYVEEPLSDPSLLPVFSDESHLPVALDETLVGIEPVDLERHRYARAVVLKPTFLGGIIRTLRVARRATTLGMLPVVSSAYESGVGTGMLVILAAVVGERAVPAGLDTYRRLAEDVIRPRLDLPAPEVDAWSASGPGREVNRRLLTPVG